MEAPTAQKMAVLTLIDPRTDQAECRTVTGETPEQMVAPHLLEFCVRHCLAPSDVGVSLSTIH